MEDRAFNPLYLAIDQGGHASRAIVFDSEARMRATAVAEIDTFRPREGWVEHEPEALIASVRKAAQGAIEQLGPLAERVRAGGFATQRSSIVCWDRKTGEALSPVISWQDRRTADWLENFSGSASLIHERTGLVLSAYYGASKFRWCLDHLPKVGKTFEEGRLAFGPMASFLLFRLLGERPHLIDPVNASRTMLWDFQTRDWSQDLLELFGVSRAPLPTCVPSRHAFGHLEINEWRIPFHVTTGDQAAALFAGGEPSPEVAFANIGTGAFIQRLTGRQPARLLRFLNSIVFEEAGEALYVAEGTVNGAGSALTAMAGELGVTMDAVMEKAPGWLATVEDPPLFLNGISGLGSPYWVPDFPSRFVGAGEAPEKIVAVIESIVFLLMANLEELGRLSPRLRRIRLTGGLARFDRLAERLASLSGLPVYRPALREATAKGLAYLLAGRPAAWGEDADERCFTPRSDLQLAARYGRWRAALEDALAEG